ncbi:MULTISPECIES: alkaline phosphatase family protein [unclassified Vibrio]|uniref:alkaline phosphatase family protein n=1 Tax=unclassified Vibrio TaxID=2614977 RepID=UPI00159E8AF9|nr:MULTISPECIES: alkaline phosphatase family protein [unclassified Vibrio]NVN79962.1 alkaline phosphatase family protein [Vibrio sp. Scap16]QLE94646.1 alkaline phosphatase family protein [Vibrio sp. Scap24]
MSFYSQARGCASLLSSLSLAVLSAPSLADISTTPVIGGVFSSSEVLKNQVLSSLSYSATLTRDAALFTIGGVTLDAYILALPLDAKTKARVIAQLSNPTYSIPLGYFLYSYYDRYSGLGSEDVFKAYLSTVYDEEVLKGFEHSLYYVGDEPVSEYKEPDTSTEAIGHHEGIRIDEHFIANMVVIYDALFEIGVWQDMETLPESYTYLINSPEDLAIIAQIQPIIVDLIGKAASGMDEGDMKSAMLAIVEDGKPENADKPNNKAQALTITLIDFVRLNLLKAYRQFVFKEERAEALDDWMQKAFSEKPEQLIQFLDSQQNKRFAVQVTVDGLQQGLIEGLVDESTPFISVAYQNHKNRAQYKPQAEEVIEPEHRQQVRFMEVLSEQTYRDPHYLPFFKKLYQEHRDNISRVGISSTPTISVRNLPIIKTGTKVSGQGGTGIPNFHFVDREIDRAYYFFGNDALQLDVLMADNKVQTMFDRLDYLKTLNCNAQYDWNAHTTYDGLVNLGLGESLRDYGEKRCVKELQERSEVEVTLREKRAALIEDIEAYQSISGFDFFTKYSKKVQVKQAITQYAELDGKGMPDYTLVYNPWPDHFAHFTGPFSDEILMPTGELNRLDYWIRQIEATYRSAGVYNKTLWGMAGDHGLTPVFYALNPEKQVFEGLQADLDYPIVVKKISSDEGEGPKITNALSYPSSKDIDVVVASTAGGNFMMDFFNSSQGWQVQPIYQELKQWTPLAAPKGENIDVIAQITQRLPESLDYMVVRESTCDPQSCAVRVIGNRDLKRVDELITREGDKLFYESLDGNRPPILLNTQTLNPYLVAPSKADFSHYSKLVEKCINRAIKEDVTTWCSSAQWTELTQLTPRPDSVNQLANIYLEDRAGTVNLFPKAGIGYNTKVPGRHAGEDYLEKDAFIGFWGTPIGENSQPLKIQANGSLAPTLFEYLTGEAVVEGENGWGYPSLLNHLDVPKNN